MDRTSLDSKEAAAGRGRGGRELHGGFGKEPAAVLAAAGVTCCILLAGAAIFVVYGWLHPAVRLHLDPDATPFWGKFHLNAYLLTDLIPYFDATGQRIGHRLIVYATGVVLLLSLLPRVRRGLGVFARGGMRRGVYALVVLCTIALVVASARHQRTPIMGILLGAGGVLAVCDPRMRRFAGAGRRGAKIVCLALLGAAILPAVFSKPDMSDCPWSMLATIQMHYSLVIGVGDRMAQGQRLFSQVTTEYGTLFQFVAACYERHIGTLSMGDYFRLLQATNAIYLVAAMGVYYGQSRGKWVLCLLAMGLVIPFYHFRHQCLLFPNQAAWRTMSFPLMLLACVGMRRWPIGWASVVLGVLCGVAIGINMESGAAASAGAAAYVYFRHVLSARNLVRAAAVAMIGAGVGVMMALGALLVVWHLLLPPVPQWAEVSQALAFVRFFVASNFGAAEFKWSIPATVIFAHAVFVLIHSGFAFRGGAGQHGSVRAAAAAMVIVWFAYYFNRPLDWDLSSLLMPYGILLIDLARTLWVYFSRRRVVDGLSAGAFAVVCLAVVPQIFASWERSNFLVHGAYTIAGFTAPAPERGGLLSGVYFPKAGAEDVAAKAAFLREAAKGEPPVYITTDSFLVPKVSGVYSRVLLSDFFVETTMEDRYREMLAESAGSGAGRIFLDSPESLKLGAPSYAGLYYQLRKDLRADYRPVSVESGWEIWAKR